MITDAYVGRLGTLLEVEEHDLEGVTLSNG